MALTIRSTGEQWLSSDFSQFIEDFLDTWHVPGVAIAVVKDGQIVVCQGYGKRNITHNLPVTSETLFPIASCTKAFTAMSVGLLVDDGKLDWDQPVRDYLSNFQLKDTFATERMTPRDLLTHRSGLPRHDLVWCASHFTRSEILERLRYLEPNRDFRYAYQYQNMMYMVAGLLVGQVTNGSWEQFVQTHIFDPLGMHRSNFSTTQTQQMSDFATPYQYREGKLKEIPFFIADGESDAVGPCGNIKSTITDMAKWLQLHLNGGKVAEQSFISETHLKEMHTPQILINDPQDKERFDYDFMSYGLGWEINAYQGCVLIEHGGVIDGFKSFVSFIPRQQLGVIVLSNADSYYNPIPKLLTYTIYDRLLGVSQVNWSDYFKPIFDKKVAAQNQKASQPKNPQSTIALPQLWEAYLGDYENPGYGRISIRRRKDELELVMNDKCVLKIEREGDTLEVIFAPYDSRFPLSFEKDKQGTIVEISLPLEPRGKNIVFQRCG